MRNPRVGVGVIVKRNGKFVIGKRKGAHGAGTWAPPGGWLEWLESPYEAAHREVLEETGMAIQNPTLFHVTNDIFTKDNHCVTIWLIADWCGGEARIKEPDKFVDIKWVSMATMPSNTFLTWKNLTSNPTILSLLHWEFPGANRGPNTRS